MESEERKRVNKSTLQNRVDPFGKGVGFRHQGASLLADTVHVDEDVLDMRHLFQW